ncbi:MAG TPA: hypothetical protein VIK91_20470 [Nannocystis sp.]
MKFLSAVLLTLSLGLFGCAEQPGKKKEEEAKGEAKPVDNKTSTKPADAKPADAKPADAAPADAKSGEAAPPAEAK